MSRVIKEYPFCAALGEKLTASADSIEAIRLPGVFLDIVSLDTRRSEVVSLKTKCYCLEETQGIHIYLVQVDHNNNDTEIRTKERVIDEVAFCDTMHECFNQEKQLEEDKFVREVITDLVRDYVMDRTSSCSFTTDFDYEGFGVICTGDNIIGTTDIFKVNNQFEISFDHCVGNVNLNNVKDCKIFFKVNKASFCIADISNCKVSTDSNYYCTYKIPDYTISRAKLPVDDKVWKSFAKFEDDVDKFFADRIAFLEEQEQKSSNEADFTDGLFDLL